jgi:predicted nucleic acid-binding protein
LRFWDSSALVPLFIAEPSSDRMDELLSEDRSLVVWWGTPLECLSAIGRRERAGEMDAAEASTVGAALWELAARWVEVAPVERVRDTAARLVRVHDLRAGDALQLAASSVASEDGSDRLAFVTLDDRLALAASREGFRVLPA